MSETTGSVSKACFVFKPKSKKFKEPKASDYVAKENIQQLKTYQDLSHDINEEIDSLGSELNAKIFDDLLKFSSGAHQKPTRKVVSASEIPTAALITGVNTPDHHLMFSNLASLLRQQVSPHVAMLMSKDCPNLKQLMAKTLTQIMDSKENLDDSDLTQKKSKKLKLRNFTLDVLSAWYQTEFQQSTSRPPVVILFEDLEAFPAHVLQDFILICSHHVEHLPIVLIFGIATTVTAVHRILPHQVSSLLCMEKFQATPSTDYLSLVMDKVVMTARYPFKVGHRVFRLLLDMFLYHDFAVVNFVRCYQFAMMQHFTNSPLSIVCCPLSQLWDRVASLTHGQLEQLRRAVTFRSYVERQDPDVQIQLLTNDDYFKDVVYELVNNLHIYQENFFPILLVLNILTRGLPKHPLGKQLRETYSLCLESNIFEEEVYKEAMDLISTMSRDDLVCLLKQCLPGLETSNGNLGEVVEKFKEYVYKFENIEDLSQAQETAMDVDGDELTLPKKMDMHTLRKTLLEMKKKKLTVYELLRRDLCDYLDQLFRKYLQCPRLLPLYETCYYDVASEVRQHRNAAPRAAIQIALTNPYVYLRADSLQTAGEGITNALPDISIVYKLHLECGRLINLYDWLQAFITVVTSGEPEDVIDKELKQPSQTMQARFIRAVSELQFLGFIKPTKRKTDHVARLTWGGC